MQKHSVSEPRPGQCHWCPAFFVFRIECHLITSVGRGGKSPAQYIARNRRIRDISDN